MKPIIEDSGKKISWLSRGRLISKSYQSPLLGYEVLPDSSGVLLLEPPEEVGPENAVIYDEDGSERWRLPFNSRSGHGLLFDRVGTTDGTLVAVAVINNRDVMFELDYTACKYSDIHETR